MLSAPQPREHPDGLPGVLYDVCDSCGYVRARTRRQRASRDFLKRNPRMLRGHMMRGGEAKAGTFSDNVMELRYKHKQDGKLYKHTFNKGVRMRGNEDGTVTLSHPTKQLWGEF